MNKLEISEVKFTLEGHVTDVNSLSFSASVKSENSVGHDFVFAAINEFLHRYPKGYFTIVGVPGSGKSAILTQLLGTNSCIISYNAQIPGKGRVEEFLTDVCTQLITKFQNLLNSENLDFNSSFNDYDSRVFSLLLQQISQRLSPDQKLIIVIDGLDRVDIHSQAAGTNLLHLPRYLPDQVYFIFARRPYKKSHSGLLIEAPSQILDLADFANGFYDQVENINNIPSNLETYYQQHWIKMQGDGLSDVAINNILRVLTAKETQPMSILEISQKSNINVFDVTEIIETWLEFLQETREGKEVKYQLYHHNFRLYLLDKILP